MQPIVANTKLSFVSGSPAALGRPGFAKCGTTVVVDDGLSLYNWIPVRANS